MLVQIPPPAAVAPPAWTCEVRAPIASPAALKPGVYRLDPRRTRVSFKVSQIGPMSVRGVFPGASGALTVHDHDPTLIELSVRLPVARVKASSASATAALKSAAMLDSVAYPTIGFQSTRVVVTGAATIDILGDLTLHGVSRPVVLRGRRTATADGAPAYDLTTTIRRGEFGVRGYRGLVGDKVKLDIHAVLTPTD